MQGQAAVTALCAPSPWHYSFCAVLCRADHGRACTQLTSLALHYCNAPEGRCLSAFPGLRRLLLLGATRVEPDTLAAALASMAGSLEHVALMGWSLQGGAHKLNCAQRVTICLCMCGVGDGLKGQI